jgi:L-threonylcarbamoyladenylate synthase
VPLAAPSANRSGGISPTQAGHVVASLGDAVALVLDDGACPAGVESTIVMGRRVLRPGPVTAEALAAVLGAPVEAAGGAVVAPGMLASHYAPGKPVRLDATEAAPDEWLIGFGPVAGDDTLSATGDVVEAAARLFEALHRADAGALARIAVAPVPERGLGVAVNDRLRRAAADR